MKYGVLLRGELLMGWNSLNTKRVIGIALMAGGIVIIGIIVPTKVWLFILGGLLIWYGYVTVKSM
jgi:uncharacterized membrane protein